MKRREWWVLHVEDIERCDLAYRYSGGDTTHVREVLPDTPDDEWVDELIVRAAAVCRHHNGAGPDIDLLEHHLAKRGKQ